MWNRARGAWETEAVNLLCGHSAPFSATWPASGSMRNGHAYARRRSALHTVANGCSSLRGLLPTPTAGFIQDTIDPAVWRARRERMKARHPGMGDMGLPLGLAVRLLPTPKASDGAKGSPNQRNLDGSLTLPSAAARLLPTPSASDHGTNDATAEKRRARNHQVYLSNVMTSLGDRTPKPSPDGNSSPDAHPGQLMIEDD